MAENDAGRPPADRGAAPCDDSSVRPDAPCECSSGLREPCGRPQFDRDSLPCKPLPRFYHDFPHLLGRSPATPLPRPVGIKGSADTRRRVEGLLRTANDATEGCRNETLFWAACRFGEMLAAGDLVDVPAVVDALTTVGLAVGLTPNEIRGTIRSGLAASGLRP